MFLTDSILIVLAGYSVRLSRRNLRSIHPTGKEEEMQAKETVQVVRALAKNDPDLLVAGVMGAAVTACGYAVLAGTGYGLARLIGWLA